MKFLHVADFHLDSAFSGFERDVADQKRAELRECFADAMKIAKENEVDLVLMPGDIFDTPYCTANTRKFVFDAIANAGCPVVIAPGNHDYYTKNGIYADRSLPENAYVFNSNELGRFDFDDIGVSVIGYAFTSDRYDHSPLASGDVPLSGFNTNILCAHTELSNGFSKYAPLTTFEIAKYNFAYAALGHVHIAPEPQKVSESVIAYSGFPQGRSFDETGVGGAYLVDYDPKSGTTRVDRIKLSRMIYQIERVDVTALDCDKDVIERVLEMAKSKNYGENTALRVILVGSVSSDYSINEAKLACAKEFSHFALMQIKNDTTANFDLEYLERDISIRGEIYRELLPLLNSVNEEERAKASMALKFAFAALDKREFGIDG